MTHWQEQTKTEVVVLSKDELKATIREVLKEYRFNHQPSQEGWMNPVMAAKYLGVSRTFLHKVRKEVKIDCYQDMPGGIVWYSKEQCNYF